MGASKKDRIWYDSVRESYERLGKLQLGHPRWVPDDSQLSSSKPNAPEPDGSLLVAFDPWRNPIAKEKRAYFKKVAEARGQYNLTSPSGVQSYVLDETDEDMCLDPIALALHRRRQKFVEDIRTYVAPYDVQVFFEAVQLSAPQAYNLRLLFNGKEVNHRRIPFATAYTFRTDLQDLYDEFDNMIEQFEKANSTNPIRSVEKSVRSKLLSNVAFTDIEIRYSTKFRGDGQPMAQLAKKQDILCPDHGNPMMARKDEPGVLHCLIPGCTKRAKLKSKPVEAAKLSKMTLGQKLNAVLNEPKDAEERPDGDLGKAPEPKNMSETVTGKQIYSSAQGVTGIKTFSDALNAVAPIVQTQQRAPLGYVPNNNPVFIYVNPVAGGRAYLVQKDQVTGNDIYIDITTAQSKIDVSRSIAGLADITVTLHPRQTY